MGGENPCSVNIKGPAGPAGEGFTIKGYFPTLAALEAAIPDPEEGDNYGVGSVAPYDIYTWDTVHLIWVNNGTIQGPPGGPGDPGTSGATFTPSVSDNGNLSWTNDRGLPNPPTVNIKGPPGTPGTDAMLPVNQELTLDPEDWEGVEAPYSQTVAVSGVLEDEGAQLIQIVLSSASREAWKESGVECIGQGAGSLTFTAQEKPTENISIFVVLQALNDDALEMG